MTSASVTVMVGRGSCIEDACPAGELRNLNLDNCACESLHPHAEDLVDARETTERHWAFNHGDTFTLREWSVNGYFQYNLPSTDDITCIEITNTYGDPWDRYRQVSFVAITADCVYEYVRYEVMASGDLNPDVNETLKVTIWPSGEPSHDGILVDLDAQAPGPI
jgi:hypothetical protein